MKSYLCHYRNKYPGGRVEVSEEKLDVYDSEGNLRVALRKTGAGSYKDIGEEIGALDKHDLDPIPKNARVYKLYADGKVKPSEESQERIEASKALAFDGKILSIEEYYKKGARVEADGSVFLPQKEA